MSSLEDIFKFNAQTAGREKLIRLCQYTTKFVHGVLRIYYTQYAKGGIRLLEIIYKLRELENYLISSRRLLNFGRCIDQFYLALRSMQLNDPVVRMTLSTSKLWLSFQMFAEHVLWLHQMGFLIVEKQKWVERANKFWLYSVTVNLLRDFYEIICVIQQRRIREQDNLNSGLMNYNFKTPLEWAKKYPKLCCDLVKNSCDFWIPFAAINNSGLHPTIIALLALTSTSMSMMQIYDKKYRLSPS